MRSQIITGLTKNNAFSQLRNELEVTNRVQVVWLLFLQAGYKRAVLGKMICQMDRTGQSGPLSKVVPNIPVEPNRNGPFHLIYF